MKREILFGCIFAGAAVLMNACSPSSAEDTGTTEESSERIYPVKVQPIKKETITRSVEYTANLKAFEEIHFAPASPGRIKKIHVDVGSRISKGEVLVEMDRTQLQQAVSQLESAKSSFQRLDTLYALGSIPEQQYEQAKTQYEVAKANVNFLMENTTLTSPINGIVTGKYYENGEMYSGAPNTQAGKAAVVTLEQINPLKAIVAVSESLFPEITEGMPATISTDIYPDLTFKGNVYKIHPTINPATRTFQVEIKINNPNEKLRPGIFARVSLETGTSQAIVVPAISIIKQEGTNNRYVFINNNGNAKQMEVKIGKRFDDKIELQTNGLHEGDELIVAGQARLMDGVEIEVER